MAQIPMGNFGQQVAGASRPAQVLRGDPVGEATQRLGQTAISVAGDMAQAQTRLDLAERQKQMEVAETAERGREALALENAQAQLADLHDSVADGVRTGAIPKDKAESEWNAQSTKLVGAASEQFRASTREIVTARLKGAANRLGNGVRKAREQRDRQDITVSLDGILESAQRDYARDPAGAQAKVAGAFDALGPQSTYTPEVVARKRQAWLEDAQFNVGYQAVSAGRADRKALDAAEGMLGGLTALDPQKRAVLSDRIAGYRLHLDQQAEMRAARVQREGEARLKKAEAEFNVFQGLADKGTMLDPAYIDRTVAATAGTPYQAGIQALVQQAREVGGLASQPLSAQRATLATLDAYIAQNGRSPATDKRREQIEKVVRGSEEDFKRDPLSASVQRGVLQGLQPLDLSAGFQGVAQQIQARVQQAAVVSTWAGRPVSPFTPDEAGTLARQFAVLGPDQKAASLVALTSTMSPAQGQALAAQMDGHDRPLALAMAAGTQRTTFGRSTAELILRGAQAAKDKGVKEETGAEFGLRATLAKEVGDAVGGKTREDTIDTARFIYMGKRAAGESISERGAVALALGGPIVEHNGRKVPVPAGLDEDTLRQRLQAIPAARIASQVPDGQVLGPGGKTMSVAEFLAALPDAQLEAVGQGRYAVRAGGVLMMNAQRRPIVVDVAP